MVEHGMIMLSKQKDQQFEGSCWQQAIFPLPQIIFIPKEPGPVLTMLHPDEQTVTCCWGTLLFHIPSHQHHILYLLIAHTQQMHSNTILGDGNSHHVARRLSITAETKLCQGLNYCTCHCCIKTNTCNDMFTITALL